MKIDKIIFAADDSYFLDFWPIQSKICKEVLNIEPVLFRITEDDSEFYNDGCGLVKNIKKIKTINTGAQAAIGRMFFTKYFPNDVCVVSDIDLLIINKNYLQNSIKNFEEDSFVIYVSDAYDENRTEAKEYVNQEFFEKNIGQLYPYFLNVGKGKTFNKILDTDCSFSEYLYKHKELGNKDLFWGVDECYFSKCVNKKNHEVKIEKLIRGYESPWKCSGRIERHRFPVQLEFSNEINSQKNEGIYDFKNLKKDNIIEINLPRPYNRYKDEIDNVVNLILEKEKNMKKIVLIGSYCDTKEKIDILYDNIKILKNLGLDTLVISPVTLPSEIIELSDFVFFTKENPLLNWPVRGFTFWRTHYSSEGWVTMHRNVTEYGWAALYQIKKMSQIALSYDYDLFYHIIYDLEIDQYVIDTINSDKSNLIHPRINPNKNDEWWDATLHFMVFDREIMSKIVDVIVLEDYLEWDGVAEGQALRWTELFPIEISKTPVRDKIYYWGDRGFFDYSFNQKYKMFIGKTNNTNIWVESDGNNIKKELSSNLRIYFYDIDEKQNIEIVVDGIIKTYEINENKLLDLEVDSKSVEKILIQDNDGKYDYSLTFKEIDRNLVYFGN